MIATSISQLFVMPFGFDRIGQKKDLTKQVDQYIIFERVLFFYHCNRAVVGQGQRDAE